MDPRGIDELQGLVSQGELLAVFNLYDPIFGHQAESHQKLLTLAGSYYLSLRIQLGQLREGARVVLLGML